MADQSNPSAPKRVVTNLAGFNLQPASQMGQSVSGAAYDGPTTNYNYTPTPNRPPNQQAQPASYGQPKPKPPSYKHGGVVKATGLARVHKGEVIIPKKHAKKFKQLSPFFGE